MVSKDGEAMGIIIIMGAIGLIVAYLVGELNTDAIIVDEVVTATLTIAEIQTIIILISIIVGLILAGRR